MKIRLGTRASELALWQANRVRDRLLAEEGVEVELIKISTEGDRVRDRPLRELAGSGFFTKEIERALLDDEIDLAVHSHKDLALAAPDGLVIVAVPPRAALHERLLIHADAHDPGGGLLPVASGARVGTGAPRRREQLKVLRPDLDVVDLRGNVPTRVERVRSARLDAVVLAAAGLDRLALDTAGIVVVDLEPDVFVPAPAQGALGIEVRATDTELVALCGRRLHDVDTSLVVEAERLVLAKAGGGCHLPLGVTVARGEDDESGPTWIAHAFLGPGHPEEGAPARWAIGHGGSPLLAATEVWRSLATCQPTGRGPLGGRRVALVGSGEEGGRGKLAERLPALGAEVVFERVLAFEDTKAPTLSGLLGRLGQGDAVVCTSQEAARRLADHSVPQGALIAAVGPATAAALKAIGWTPGLVGSGGAADLARRLEIEPGHTVVFPCAEQARPELPKVLAERGVKVESVAVYRTVEAEDVERADDVDARVYMSPSAVHSAVSLGHEDGVEGVARLGLGQATCDALQDEGLRHTRPKGSGADALIAALRVALRRAPTREPPAAATPPSEGS